MTEYLHYSSQGYPYGLDWSRDAESIGDASLTIAENCEYDPEDGGLATCPGVISVYHSTEGDITSLYHDEVNNCFYYSVDGKLYQIDEAFRDEPVGLGTLSGTGKPHYALYNHTVLVASGSHLQFIENKNLKDILSSPHATGVALYNARVLTWCADDANLHMSAVGSYQDWKVDATKQTSAQQITVGYGSVGNVVGVGFIADNIIVYKEDGQCYRLYKDAIQAADGQAIEVLASAPVSRTAYLMSNEACLSVSNQLYSVGIAGFQLLQPSDTSADVAPVDIGRNVNGRLSHEVTSACRIFHVPSKKQIWIQPSATAPTYIYSYVSRYEDGRGVFTTRRFTYSLHDVATNGNNIYVAEGAYIGLLSADTDKDLGVQIKTHIVGPNRLPVKRRTIVMNRNIVTHNRLPGTMTVKVGKKTTALLLDSVTETTIMDADTDIVDADTPIDTGEGGYAKNLRPSCGSNRSVQADILVTRGAIALRQLEYDYLEV